MAIVAGLESVGRGRSVAAMASELAARQTPEGKRAQLARIMGGHAKSPDVQAAMAAVTGARGKDYIPETEEELRGARGAVEEELVWNRPLQTEMAIRQAQRVKEVAENAKYYGNLWTRKREALRGTAIERGELARQEALAGGAPGALLGEGFDRTLGQVPGVKQIYQAGLERNAQQDFGDVGTGEIQVPVGFRLKASVEPVPKTSSGVE